MNLLELGVIAAQNPRAAIDYRFGEELRDLVVECADCAFGYLLSMKGKQVTETLERSRCSVDLDKKNRACGTCGIRLVIYEPSRIDAGG